MKYSFLICALLIVVLVPCQLHAQQYAPDAKGCKANFKVIKKQGGEVVRGSLTHMSGQIVFDPAHAAGASFDIKLKKLPYFNVAKYPAIKIKSTSVTQDKPGSIFYTLHGDLTINGITKPAKIQFTATPSGTGYIFRGALELSRQDFGLGNGSDDMGDNVSVFIEVHAEATKGATH